MKTGKDHSKWSMLDIVVAAIAWVVAIALLYTVIIKVRILIDH